MATAVYRGSYVNVHYFLQIFFFKSTVSAWKNQDFSIGSSVFPIFCCPNHKTVYMESLIISLPQETIKIQRTSKFVVIIN